MRVKEYMTSQVFSVQEDHKLLIAEEVMHWANCRHIPVIDNAAHLVGLITQRDLLRASLSALPGEESPGQREHLTHIHVRDVMGTDVAVIDPEATIQVAAKMMRRGKFGCLPVVDIHNKLLGILTENDLLRVLENLSFAPSVEPA